MTLRTRDELKALYPDNHLKIIPASAGRDTADSITPAVIRLVAAAGASLRSRSMADYVCDGTADEVEINAAIAAVAATGGVVQLSEGQFNIAAPISISASNTRLCGVGQRSTTLFLSNGANSRVVYVGAASDIVGVILSNFGINGNQANQTDGADESSRAGIMIDGLAGGEVSELIFENLYITLCRGTGISCDGQPSAHIIRPRFRNVTTLANGVLGASPAADGIHVGYAEDVDFVQVNSQFNTDTGVALDHVSGVVHHGTVCRGNVSNQFTFARGSDNGKFIGVTADGFSNTGSYGIRTGKFGEGTSGLSTYLKVVGSHIFGCSVSAFLIEDHSVALITDCSLFSNGATMQTAGTVVFLINGGNNFGWTGASGGTATVPNGSTSVVVTHSLGSGLTPATKNIEVTPTNNLGNATKFFVSNPTATQFTINVNVDPGATTATFAWQVRMDV